MVAEAAHLSVRLEDITKAVDKGGLRMVCPSYTVSPGSEGTPALFGLPVTLIAPAGAAGFGLEKGKVFLVCSAGAADETEYELPVPTWDNLLISATLVRPPVACPSPHQISVRIPPAEEGAEGAWQDCRQPLTIRAEKSPDEQQNTETQAVLPILFGVVALGIAAVLSIFALGWLGWSTLSPTEASPLAQQTEGAPQTEEASLQEVTTPVQEGTTPTTEEAVSKATTNTGGLGVAGQIASVLGAIGAAAVGGIAGLLVRRA